MCAKSKALWLVLLPALLLVLLVLTTSSGEAREVSPAEHKCNVTYSSCELDCSAKSLECGPPGSKNAVQCYKDCSGICELKHSDCLRDASKSAPKVPFKPKIQPKVQPGGIETPKITPKVVPKVTPGGAEQPEADSDMIPKVQPKGGVKQY